jgi:ADP-ribose pyrophosphatase
MRPAITTDADGIACGVADSPVHIISTRRLLDDFLSVDEAIVDVGGDRQRWLSLERGDSAAAIVRRLDDGKILLTRQFRFPTFRKGPGWIVEVAAGVIEDGEDPADSVRRELIEELGYAPSHLEPIGCFYLSPGGSSERVFLFYAEVSESDHVSAGGGLASEGEDIDIVELDLDELDRQLRNGELRDAKTLIAVHWLLSRTVSERRRSQ